MNKTVLKKRADLIKRMCKYAEKMSRPLFSTAKIFNEKYYACDGHRVVCFMDISGEVPFEVIEHENTDGLYTQKKFFDDFNRNKRYGIIELKTPDLKQLKAFKKAYNAFARTHSLGRERLCYDFGFNYPLFNLDYVIDVLETIPDARFYILETDKSRKYGYKFIPVYAEDAAGNSIMFLPIRAKTYADKAEWRFKYDWFTSTEKIVGKDDCEKDLQYWYSTNEYGYTADNINIPI